jgi:pimeloyl-ACP methyl ester carboxylesterase
MSFVFSKTSPREKLPLVNSFDFLGAKINFRILGKGLPVILLHGSMVYDPWGGFEKVLAKKHTVYWIDLPGFGGSDTVKGRLHDTDLFSECVIEFIKSQGLLKAPIISLSLGTIVAAKLVESGHSEGKQIMVGAPGKLFGDVSRLACYVPVFIRRWVASTEWGKKALLIPMLRGNTGDKKGDDVRLLHNLMVTDPKSLADIDYLREIEKEMPRVLSKIDINNIAFIYGELDNQKDTNSLIKKYFTIQGAGHSPFGSHGKELIKEVERAGI